MVRSGDVETVYKACVGEVGPTLSSELGLYKMQGYLCKCAIQCLHLWGNYVFFVHFAL